MRDQGRLDLHLDVSPRTGREPAGVGRSLEAALREAVRSGRLPAGTPLPGSRALAGDLGISRGTVVKVYTQLAAEGWLTGRSGSGTRVSELAAAPGQVARTPDRTGSRPGMVDLRPGRPDVSAFPRTTWVSAVRRALAEAAAEDLYYGDPAGLPQLREAVAGHLARTRGVRADPGLVVVVGGFAAGLALLGRALHGLGVREIATEDPGLARHRDLLRAAGHAIRPLTVDSGGADPAGLTAATGAVLLTPAHQHPWGVVLSPERRLAFTEWARRRDGYLVEDDYDGEFRYDQQPVGAMQALAPDRVVFAGSVSKTLAPGMRLGWLVVPPSLLGPVLRAVEETGVGVPVVEQLAMAGLIGRGEYDRHIRRTRLVYRRRRDDLARRLAAPRAGTAHDACSGTGSGHPAPLLEGVAAGLHALLLVGTAEREVRLVEAAARAGLRLHGLHTLGYWHDPADGRPAALVLGYATPPQHAWRRCLDILTAVLDQEP